MLSSGPSEQRLLSSFQPQIIVKIPTLRVLYGVPPGRSLISEILRLETVAFMFLTLNYRKSTHT